MFAAASLSKGKPEYIINICFIDSLTMALALSTLGFFYVQMHHHISIKLILHKQNVFSLSMGFGCCIPLNV